MKTAPQDHTTEENPHHEPEQSGPAPFGKGSEVVHHFKFEGKRYRLEKRSRNGVAPRDWYWYCAFTIRGKRYHNSTATNVKAAAEAKAIRDVIRPAKEGRMADIEAAKITRRSSTLADVIEVYKSQALIKAESVRNNIGALLLMFEWARGSKPAAATVKLDAINKGLLREFQGAMVAQYCADAPKDAAAQREARERALRSSRSIYNQAKSLFAEQNEWIDRYRSAGLVVPECVREFAIARAEGKLHRETYAPPDDAVIRKTFAEIENLAESMPEVYRLFWLALGTGMRRGECADARWEHFVERDGRLWVRGGTGKDGRQILLPVVDKLLAEYSSTSPNVLLTKARRPDGFILPGDERMRHDTIPYKLNLWLESLGWNDEKKLHALRAFVGSKIYEIDPRLAQLYLRHKSLATTEWFYSHFAGMIRVAEKI
jgi:integrase